MAAPYVPVIHGAALDRPDEQDTIDTAGFIAQSLAALGFATEVVTVGPDLEAIDTLAARNPHVVFNLVEALGGEAAKAGNALERLAALGVDCTGASAASYAASNGKLSTKARLAMHAIPTPAFWLAGDEPPATTKVIVKSRDEHGSFGIDAGSVVTGRNAETEIARREASFGGCFFAELYVEGREFNVSVIETEGAPRVLPIAEIDFSDLPDGTLPIVDFAAKWDPSAVSYHTTPRRFGLEKHEAGLADEIRDLTLATWHALGLSGYARVDFRVTASGCIFVLEANANPCLAPDAGFAAAAAEAGLTYDQVISAIVEAAVHHAKVVA